MMKHPVTYFLLGVGTVWAYHHFMKPLPAPKA